MIIASVVVKNRFSSLEYLCALCVCFGLVLFAAADWTLTPSFHPIGLAFVSLSVCADAVLPNAQERLFRMNSSRLEVTFYTNIFTLIAMTVTTYLSGDLSGFIFFARHNRELCHYVAIYTFVAYIAISFHMNVVQRFGGVSAVLLATGRKGMTLLLSFLLFPKTFSWLYVVGAILVLGGLSLSSIVKIREKNRRNTMEGEEISPLVITDGSADKNSDGRGSLKLKDRHEIQISGIDKGENGIFGWASAHKHQN